MDKELNTLQKEINLHVNDIKRIQGLISRLNVTKGKTQDELRRIKDRARKTMVQLNNHKKVETAAEKTLKGGGGATMAAGATIAGVTGGAEAGGVLLFSNMKKKDLGNMMTSSLGNTLNSNSTYVNNILPLKYLLKTSHMTKFEIATEGASVMKPINVEDESHKRSNMGLQTKIKDLLDQRKPPTETLPPLLDMYDDEMNLITDGGKTLGKKSSKVI